MAMTAMGPPNPSRPSLPNSNPIDESASGSGLFGDEACPGVFSVIGLTIYDDLEVAEKLPELALLQQVIPSDLFSRLVLKLIDRVVLENHHAPALKPALD